MGQEPFGEAVLEATAYDAPELTTRDRSKRALPASFLPAHPGFAITQVPLQY